MNRRFGLFGLRQTGIVQFSLALLVVGGLTSVTQIAPVQASQTAASLGTFNVKAADRDIFNAGHPLPPLGDGAPLAIALPASAVPRSIEISNASGGVSQGAYDLTTSADGGYDPWLAMNIDSYHGISGILADPGMGAFLAAVFTGPSEPADPAPPRLDYTAAAGQETKSQLVTTPVLNQLFFVGDGLTQTGSGITQQFVVPAGATTLWLGLSDAGYYQGTPIPTSGNAGSYTVSVGVRPYTQSGISVTPPTGTVTTSFVATMHCRQTAPPGQFSFFLTAPDGARTWLTKGPSLVILSDQITTGNYSRNTTFKVGPDLALAQAHGVVYVQGSCAGDSETTRTFEVAQTPFAVIGDSYTAGEGNKPFTRGTDLNPSFRPATGCHRSSTGWAFKVAAGAGYNNPASPTDEPGNWTFAACSGAKLKDLTDANTRYARDGEAEVAQLNAVTAATTVVAMTNGGNDVGFAKILWGCAVGPPTGAFSGCSRSGSSVRKDVEKRLKALRPQLVDAYVATASRMAPDGTLYVAGYPHLFGSSKSAYKWLVLNQWGLPVPACGIGGIYGIAYSDAKWINQILDRGNQIIADAATQVNAGLVAAHSQRRVVFVGDSRTGLGGAVHEFDTHGLCDSGTSFLNGLSIDAAHRTNFQTSFHPNLDGQTAYARAFESSMGLPLSLLTKTAVSP